MIAHPTVTRGSTEQNIYTAITFAPVQGFIERSRKLRDLYGSSYILSYLADAICSAAIDNAKTQNNLPKTNNPSYPVISPALLNLSRGTPNKILIAGEFPKDRATASFDEAWQNLVNLCQNWLEDWIKQDLQIEPCWNREWSLWRQHTWEFFWATGPSIQDAIATLEAHKHARDWTGINWTGESSTLSGADAAAYPTMSLANPKNTRQSIEDTKIKEFYQKLSEYLKEAIDPRESLSIPELTKRLITINDIALPLTQSEIPRSFKQANRWQEDKVKEVDRQETGRWTGWFKGDGDRVSDHLKKLLQNIAQQHNITPESQRAQQLYAQALQTFSHQMRTWGETLGQYLPKVDKPRNSLDRDGRIVYAGGDDFLGILYRNPPDTRLQAQECIDWLSTFKSNIWSRHEQPITVSVGFVWAAPNVPQRDILQHCREAEQSAKTSGRDRLAIRILFNSGNTLEWTCPWKYLSILQHYRDRSGNQNWTHIFNDIAVLESRHAFSQDQSNIAQSLFKIYFGENNNTLNPDNWWNSIETLENRKERPVGGILGERDRIQDPSIINQTINNWVINLAKVGFHLCSST